jgi:Plasmid pRiA4b ORF-3-like protein
MPGPEMLCVYQFKVVLRGISPMIWRRLLLRSDQSIADLHYTIQIAMGWSIPICIGFTSTGKITALHTREASLSPMTPNVFFWPNLGFVFVNAFLYEYDFYDNWKHDIRLEKVLPLNSKRVFPGDRGRSRPRTLEDLGPIGRRAIRVGGHGGMLSRGRS